MSASSIKASEKVLLAIQAQVYALDKAQKWKPLSNAIITVQFLLDEQTGATRILGAEKQTTIVNSVIDASMQYRRPSDTFVQWFDSQHILYGLNLTSVADAEAFEKEFETATGKRAGGAAIAGGSQQDLKASTGNLDPNAGGSANGLVPAARKASTAAPTTATNVNAELNSRFNKSVALNNNNNSNASNTGSGSGSPQFGAAATANESLALSGTLRTGSTTAADIKTLHQLRTRIKDLELANVSVEAEKSALNETIASQSKTISSLQSQVQQLESDIDQLKTNFQQNSTNVNMWKQQLKTYQDVNEQLTNKMAELTELYEKFGDILKQ